MAERVVVTGMGVVAANAHGLDAFEQALRDGRSGIRFHEKLRDLGFACQVGGVPEVSEELKRRYFSEEALRALNSGMIYAGIAAIDCWRDAGFAVPEPGSDEVDWDTGAIIGTGIGGVDTVGEWVVPRVNEGKVRRLGQHHGRADDGQRGQRVRRRDARARRPGDDQQQRVHHRHRGDRGRVPQGPRGPRGAGDRGRRRGVVALHLGRVRRDARAGAPVERPPRGGVAADVSARRADSSPRRGPGC